MAYESWFATSALISWLVETVSGASTDVKAAMIGNAGIVLAAAVTVIGTAVFATRQYAHEREEKAKDRALEVKKEVLIDAIRGAMQVSASFGLFGDLSKTPDVIMAEYLAGVGRLSVAGAVASVPTTKAIKDLIEEAAPSLPRMIALRRPLEDAQMERDQWVGDVAKLLADADRLLSLQVDAIVASDQSKVDALQKLFVGRHELIRSYGAKRDAAVEIIDRNQPELIREGWRTQEALAKKIRAVVAQVRIDIGVDVSASDFIAAATLDSSKFQNSMDDLLKTFKREDD